MFFNNKQCCQNNFWQEEQGFIQANDCGCKPIIEPPIERCVERNICHKVEHACAFMIYKYKLIMKRDKM